MSEHLEIEQKFDVEAGFSRPDFGRLDGVSAAAPVLHHLSATYYDTADQRLAASKITLRRRTGGTDEGWHLKLPAADEGGRREIQAPLDVSAREVPQELAGRVAEVTGGAPLAPVAQLDTERTVVTLRDDGRVAAEVADDEVTARRLPPAASRSAGGRSRSRCPRPIRSCSGQRLAAVRGGRAPGRPRVQAGPGARPLRPAADPAANRR